MLKKTHENKIYDDDVEGTAGKTKDDANFGKKKFNKQKYIVGYKKKEIF